MILQLSTGRFIEISVEQYFNMTDLDFQYLNSLGSSYTKDNPNPFYGSLNGLNSDEDDSSEEFDCDDYYESD